MKSHPSPASRTRSPAYPAIGLPEAVNIVRALYHAIQNQAAPHDVVARALDMKSGGSTLIGRLSALRKFGLLESRSVGPSLPKSYRLTKLACNLALLPVGSAEWLQAARDAAGRPVIYRELWEKFGPQFSDLPTMSRYLTRERGFNLRSVSSMIGDFMATMDYAQIAGAVEAPRRSGLDEEVPVRLPVEAWSMRDYALGWNDEFDLRDLQGSNRPSMLRPTGVPRRGAPDDAEYFSITLPGSRELRFSCPMSEEEWELVQSALQVWKDQIVAPIGTP